MTFLELFLILFSFLEVETIGICIHDKEFTLALWINYKESLCTIMFVFFFERVIIRYFRSNVYFSHIIMDSILLLIKFIMKTIILVGIRIISPEILNNISISTH